MNDPAYSIDLRRTTPAVAPMVAEPPAQRRRRYPFAFRALTSLVIVGLIVSPFSRAYASDEPAPTATVVSEPVTEPVPEVIPESVPEPEPVVEEVAPEEDAPAVTEEVEEVEEVDPTEDVSDETVDETVDESADEEVISDAGDAEPVDDVAVESAEEEDETSDGEVLGTTTQALPASSQSAAEPEEPTEPEDTAPPGPAQNYSTNDSEVVFSTADCVVVRDDEFYCVKGSAQASAASTQAKRAAQKDAAYTKRDAEGDLEIFLRRDGKVVQITTNSFDDESPAYDPVSGRIVWQASVKDRYQIFLYDIATHATVQLTSTSYNNTNPSIDGSLIAWQGWEDDNWEIFTARFPIGASDSTQAVIERLTVSGDHDMFPKVQGNYVAWQSRVYNEWQSLGQNIATGERTVLGPGTGGDVESAKLVLLVERRDENGVVQRMGYEVDTGEAIDLGTPSREVPAEIPQDPLKDQAGVLPSNATTTIKTAPKDDDADEPDTFPVTDV